MKKLIVLMLLAFVGCGSVGSDPVQITTAFSYTAPGDDDWTGQAAMVQIRVAFTADSLTNNWNACTIISEHTPPLGGVFDTVAVSFDVETGVDYYIGAKAVDEADNWNNVSNIIMRNYADVTPPANIGDFGFVD